MSILNAPYKKLGNFNSSKPKNRGSTRLVGPMTEAYLNDNRIESDLKKVWLDQGIIKFPSVYSGQVLEDYLKTISSFRDSVDDGKDINGLGNRIGQLHQKFPNLLRIAVDEKILKFISWAINDDPVLFGSLNFEKGTEQEAHIDAIFFWPEPSYSMCGCWVALEDSQPDSGPLFYVPKSHTWPFSMSEDVVRNRPELALKRDLAKSTKVSAEQKGEIASEIGNVWTEDFIDLENKYNSQRISMPMKAGDVVIWHSLLAHGGGVRTNLKSTRKSAVFHFIGKNTKLYTHEQFMLYDEGEFSLQAAQPMNLKNFEGKLDYMYYPHVVVYPESGQNIIPL